MSHAETDRQFLARVARQVDQWEAERRSQSAAPAPGAGSRAARPVSGANREAQLEAATLYAPLDALTERVAAIEQRPQLHYAGTWEAGRTYHPGEFVTKSGSLWHAEQETTECPGSGSAWQLAVKRGRDGKSAR